jgi:hypothetical protein
MAGPMDFFSPGPWTDPNQPSAGQQIAGFMNDPRGQAALLQMGLSLMGGPAWGDSGASQTARAIGSGGEAITRQEGENRKQSESESKVELQEARASAASARAGQAGTAADLARERLGIARTQEEGKRERNMLGGRIRLSGMYQQYLKDVDKQNADPFRTGPPVVPPSMQDWIKQNPTLRTLGLIPDDETGAGLGSDTQDIPATSPINSQSGGSPLDRARAAIQQGAPRDKVIERLRKNGIDPTGL